MKLYINFFLERSKFSMTDVEVFPTFSKITFGGDSFTNDNSTKSMSWVTIQNPFFLAYSHISISEESVIPQNFTWLNPIKVSSSLFTNLYDKFWSNKSNDYAVIICFSLSAAYLTAAIISSYVNSGKSSKISSKDISEAIQFKISYTVILVFLIHGLPPLLPCLILILGSIILYVHFFVILNINENIQKKLSNL